MLYRTIRTAKIIADRLESPAYTCNESYECVAQAKFQIPGQLLSYCYSEWSDLKCSECSSRI